MIFSLVFFFLFLFFFARASLRKTVLFSACIGIFVYLCITVLHLVCDFFTGNGVTLSVLYHLRSGLAGADFASYGRLILYGTGGLLLGLFSAAAIYLWKKRKNYGNPILTLPCLVTLILALASHPLVTHLGTLLISGHRLTTLSLRQFIPLSPPFLPADSPKKNLVIIYLESLEHTYFDQSLFPGLTSQLRALEQEGLTFTDIRQLNSSWWTIGGIVASQCGVPLVTPSHGDSMSGAHTFYPGATCLSDILKDNGYTLTYMGGADLGFAGKGAFLKTHGYEPVLGSRELGAASMAPEELCGWGIHDDKLLDLAWERLQRLASGNRPFVLTLLTLDTHHPNGFPSASCEGIRYKSGDNPMLNTVACTDSLIGPFVRRLMQSPFSRNTVIVLLSDHLAMKNSATSLLNQRQRKNFFLVITPDHITGRIDRPGTSLDVGTTLLHLLGFTGRLGLGVNLLDPQGAPSLAARFHEPDQVLMGWRNDFLSYWEFPSLEKGLVIEPHQHRILANGHHYSTPLLITYDDSLHPLYYFNSQFKSLTQYLMDQSPDTPFIFAASCSTMWFMTDTPHQDTICLATGKLGGTVTVKALTAPFTISAETALSIARQNSSAARYERNMRAFFSRILGPEIVAMFDTVPSGSTVYVLRGRYGKFPNLYAGMPWVKKRGIRCVRDVPAQGEFYFLSRDIDQDRKRYKGFTLEVVQTGPTLTQFLQKYLNDTIIISAKDEASLHLGDQARRFFLSLGIDLKQFGYRDSFACVIDRGKPLIWQVSRGRAVILQGPPLKKLGIDRIVSAGQGAGNRSEIVLQGQDLSPKKRGLNIVIRRQDGTVRRITFDTFRQHWIGTALVKASKSQK